MARNKKELLVNLSPLTLEYWALERLLSPSRTLRKNDPAVARMASSIEAYGFKIPILVARDGEIVDGDLRLKAARKLSFAAVPVIVCDDWTPEQVRGFRLLANRSANWAEWDLSAVAEELAELRTLHFDLTLTGFDTKEIEELLAPRADAHTLESVPETPRVPVSVPGDLWICGLHRVLCGDATEATAVSRLLGTAVPVLMITDPPYGVNYDPLWREEAGLGGQRQTGTVANDDRVDWSEAFLLFPGDVVYVWHAGLYAGEVASSLQSCGFAIRSQIIWAKQHFALSRGHYHWQHEPCWYAVRAGKPASWCGDRKQATVWEVSNLNPFGGEKQADTITGHGTQKPVELMRRPLRNHTERGGLVYDPFLGSGSTLMAAEDIGRVCYGLELSPAYVDVIVERWQKLTGRKAALEEDGRSFDEIARERVGARAEVIDAAA
jgi:DNA modification methylase